MEAEEEEAYGEGIPVKALGCGGRQARIQCPFPKARSLCAYQSTPQLFQQLLF